jgi:hypothetical protein
MESRMAERASVEGFAERKIDERIESNSTFQFLSEVASLTLVASARLT